jgi:tocopherol O-methyltransferase
MHTRGYDMAISGVSGLVEDTVTRQHKEIRRYYGETIMDYKVAWSSASNHALHYGYWDASTTSHSESLLNMNREMAAPLGLRAGQRVLDAGCGVGGSAIWLAENFGVEVVGVTLSPEQCSLARKYADERGVSGLVSFEVGDYLTTALDDQSFDVFWAEESFCHALDKPAVVREAYRLLKPGGALVVEDGFRVSRNLPASAESLLKSALAGWVIDDLCTMDELDGWASEAGFQRTAVRDLSLHVMPSARRMYRLCVLWGPAEWLVYKLGIRSATGHQHFLAARRQWQGFKRQIWTVGMVHAWKPEA